MCSTIQFDVFQESHQKGYPVHKENTSYQRNKSVEVVKIICDTLLSLYTLDDDRLTVFPSSAGIFGTKRQEALVVCLWRTVEFSRPFTLTICVRLATSGLQCPNQLVLLHLLFGPSFNISAHSLSILHF